MNKQEHHVWNWIKSNIHTLDAVGGIKPFPDYAFARDLIDALEHNRILIVAKSRQMMATWTVIAHTLYHAINDEPGLYLFLSKGKRDSKELIKRLKIMTDNLPEEVGKGIKVKEEEVVFPSKARIIALPATGDAARMHSPKSVFWDEMAFTSYSESIWTAVKPAVDSGGNFIGVSTPNGTDNMFYQLFGEDNGFSKFKLHWKDHPLRDQEWETEARQGLSENRWRQEYEIDFDVLSNRVFDEYDPQLHLLTTPFVWKPLSGKTYRGIDFGYRHPYVVWVHRSPDGAFTIFDEWEGNDATVEEMMQAIKSIDKKHGINESNISISGCDPAGAAMTDSGISAVERLREQGFKINYRSSNIMTGVDIIKSLLKDANGNVNMRFSPNVKQTLHHLRHYRWDGDKPLKDSEHDHAVDALRYLIINLIGIKKTNWSGVMVQGVAR